MTSENQFESQKKIQNRNLDEIGSVSMVVTSSCLRDSLNTYQKYCIPDRFDKWEALTLKIKLERLSQLQKNIFILVRIRFDHIHCVINESCHVFKDLLVCVCVSGWVLQLRQSPGSQKRRDPFRLRYQRFQPHLPKLQGTRAPVLSCAGPKGSKRPEKERTNRQTAESGWEFGGFYVFTHELRILFQLNIYQFPTFQ